MWDSIADSISELKALDKRLQLFGASKHRYELRPTLDHSTIDQFEQEQGFKLPDALRELYTEFSNGGAGPHLGIEPLEKLISYQPSLPLQPIEELHELARADHAAGSLNSYFDEETWEKKKYFEIDERFVQGLVLVAHQGCGHRTCIVTAGDKRGSLVDFSGDGCVTIFDGTLPELFQSWITRGLEVFRLTHELVFETDLSTEQIDDKVREETGQRCSPNLVTSVLDLDSPRGSLNMMRAAVDEQLNVCRSQ